MRLFFTALLVFLYTAMPAKAQDAPVVIELFTSQGCSSCPPADEYLSELAARKNVIALGCHVTYWDRLGWKDTLGRKVCTDRQYMMSSIRRARNVFTPEILINGKHSHVGSHKGKVESSIKNAASIAPIDVAFGNGEIAITLPQTGKKAQIFLFGFGLDENQQIRSGENSGRVINYANPVKVITDLGPWDGTAKILTGPATDGVIRYAVIAQSLENGHIYAAGKN